MAYVEEYTLPREIFESITEKGLEALPEAIRVLVNHLMVLERQRHLKVGPDERDTLALLTVEKFAELDRWNHRPRLDLAGTGGE